MFAITVTQYLIQWWHWSLRCCEILQKHNGINGYVCDTEWNTAAAAGAAVSRYADMMQYGRNQMSIKNKVNWAYVYKFSCIITLNGCVDVDGKAQQNVASLFCPRWKWSKSQKPVHEQAKSVKKKCIRFRNIFRSEIHWCETSSPFFSLRVCHLFFVPWTFPLPFASIWCDTSSIAIWFCHFGVFFFFFFMHMFSTSNLIIYKKPGNERAPNTTNRKCFCVEIARTPTHTKAVQKSFYRIILYFLCTFFLDASMRTSKSERRRGRGRVFECDYHWEAASIEHALHFKWKRPTCHSQS